MSYRILTALIPTYASDDQGLRPVNNDNFYITPNQQPYALTWGKTPIFQIAVLPLSGNAEWKTAFDNSEWTNALFPMTWQKNNVDKEVNNFYSTIVNEQRINNSKAFQFFDLSKYNIPLIVQAASDAAKQQIENHSKSKEDRQKDFRVAIGLDRATNLLNSQEVYTQSNIAKSQNTSGNIQTSALGYYNPRSRSPPGASREKEPSATQSKGWFWGGKQTKSRRGKKAKQTHRKKFSKKRR